MSTCLDRDKIELTDAHPITMVTPFIFLVKDDELCREYMSILVF